MSLHDAVADDSCSCLFFILPPVGYNIHPRKTQHRGLPFGRQQPVCFKSRGGSSCLQKNTPTPELEAVSKILAE
jgi:hypothetical protein